MVKDGWYDRKEIFSVDIDDVTKIERVMGKTMTQYELSIQGERFPIPKAAFEIACGLGCYKIYHYYEYSYVDENYQTYVMLDDE